MTGWAADFSSAQLSAAQLTAAGYQGALRYITGAGKQITPPELHNLTTTPGMALALVNETYAQAAGGGYNVGRSEAQAAFTRADQLGWPHTRPIYFVLEDPHFTPPPWQVLEEYLRGVLTVAPLSRVGDYGSARQIAHMQAIGLCTYGWNVQTWPGEPTGCHLTQIYNPVPGAPSNLGGQVDPNMILTADWGQWSALTPPVRQASQETAMVTPHPTTNRRDVFYATAPDHHIYHVWTDDTGDWSKGGNEDMLGYGHQPEGAWTAAGHLLVSTVGVDGQLWCRESDGQHWLTPGWTVIPGIHPELPPTGVPGPPGPVGPAGGPYDDPRWAAVAAAVQPVK